MRNIDPLRAPCPVFYNQNCHCNILIKSPLPAAPRIQPQTSLPDLFQIFVGMSKHDNLSVTRISRNIFFIMYHIKIYSCQGKFFIMGQFFRPLLVVITTHDIKRGLRSFLSTKSIMLLIFLCHDYTFEFHFCMSVILLIVSEYFDNLILLYFLSDFILTFSLL